jgi:hypothetical protein
MANEIDGGLSINVHLFRNCATFVEACVVAEHAQFGGPVPGRAEIQVDPITVADSGQLILILVLQRTSKMTVLNCSLSACYTSLVYSG